MSASPGPVAIAFLAAAIVAVAVVAVFKFSDESPVNAVENTKQPAASSAPIPGVRALTPEAVSTKKGSITKSDQSPVAATNSPESPGAAAASTGSLKPPYQPGPSKFKNAKRPEVRKALARVGADFEAEAMWLQSINDPGVPAKEREDLIEDLNEDGLTDPAKPTREDLVLINSRIHLIERLLPSAMDKVNEDAFREARKDLVKMRDRLEE